MKEIENSKVPMIAKVSSYFEAFMYLIIMIRAIDIKS